MPMRQLGPCWQVPARTSILSLSALRRVVSSHTEEQPEDFYHQEQEKGPYQQFKRSENNQVLSNNRTKHTTINKSLIRTKVVGPNLSGFLDYHHVPTNCGVLKYVIVTNLIDFVYYIQYFL